MKKKILILGSSGKDTIYGWDGDDQIFGNEGDDIFISGKGNDYLDGGDGLDQAHFRGNFDDFSIIRDLQGVTLQDNRLIDNEGDDQITFVEKLKFDNIIVDFSSKPQTTTIENVNINVNDNINIDLSQYFLETHLQFLSQFREKTYLLFLNLSQLFQIFGSQYNLPLCLYPF